MRSRLRVLAGMTPWLAALAAGQPLMPSFRAAPSNSATELRRGSHTTSGTYDAGHNARKRSIPKQRKHRVRLRAYLRGDLRKTLTPYERGFLDMKVPV